MTATMAQSDQWGLAILIVFGGLCVLAVASELLENVCCWWARRYRARKDNQ